MRCPWIILNTSLRVRIGVGFEMSIYVAITDIIIILVYMNNFITNKVITANDLKWALVIIYIVYTFRHRALDLEGGLRHPRENKYVH